MSKKVGITGSIYIAVLILSVTLCGFVTTGTVYAAGTAANEGNIEVTLDGELLSFDVPPTIIGGRTLVPLRVIFEALGATVDWNSATKTVTGIKDSTKISLKVNSNVAYVNSNTVRIDVPATVINGRTLVPARFIAESLGTDVEWIKSTRTVTIVSPKAVTFPDPNMEAVIRDFLKKAKGDIMTSDLKKIVNLHANGKGISNLEGIQFLTNIKELYLENNKISDISPLSGNTSLEELSFYKNNISDISPLKGLTKLAYLNLYSNQISDISPISNLPNLYTLNIALNQVFDISPLKTAKNLKALNLNSNPIIDISVLKDLPNLKDLYVIKFTEKDRLTGELFNKFDVMGQKVNEIISSIIKPEMSDLEKELAIRDYIITHTKYDKENYVKGTIPDESHSPYGVFINGVAVCDGYSRSFQILLNAVGIESKMVVGDFDSLNGSISELPESKKDDDTNSLNHAWNIVKVGNEYFQVDVTADDPLTEDGSDFLSHQYFNISDRQMSIDHRWDKTPYQSCLIDGSTYFNISRKHKDKIIADNYYYIDNIGILHKKSFDGSNDVRLVDDTVSSISLDGEWIFYINKGDNSRLYKVKTDGSGRTKLSDDEIRGRNIVPHNGWVYYLSNIELNRINQDGTGKTKLNSYSIISWFTIEDGYIYYKSYSIDSRAGLYRMDLMGNNIMRICGDEPSGFSPLPDDRVNISYGDIEFKEGEWIYFINISDGKKIYRVKSDGSERVKVSDDSVDDSFLDFVGSYIYYKNLSDGRYYRINKDGVGRQALDSGS